jgi:hypothetical protein
MQNNYNLYLWVRPLVLHSKHNLVQNCSTNESKKEHAVSINLTKLVVEVQ